MAGGIDVVSRKEKKRKRMRRRRVRRMISKGLSICAVIVLIWGTAYFAKEVFVHVRNGQTAAELRGLYMSPVYAEASTPTALVTEKPLTSVIPDEEGFAAEPTAASETTILPVISDVPLNEFQEQFLDLYSQNDDLIGWIHVNDTVDYPIVWREGDNDYYMDHDFYGNESQAGWIFLDKRNQNDMSDDQLLIYGHNMRLGDMFGELDLYRDLEYVRAHPIIEIQSVWEAEPRKYVIIALYDASMNKSHDSYIKITNFNFENREAKEEYIAAVCERSIFELPCDASADDQLVTLVTCSYSHPNGRFLVVARELRDDETEEAIIEQFNQLQ